MYLDESITEKVAVIRYRFKFRRYPGGYYFIILPEGKSMPEIIKAVYLKQSYYKNSNFTIIGIAKSKGAAMELFARMAADAYKACRDVNIRSFLEKQQGGL